MMIMMKEFHPKDKGCLLVRHLKRSRLSGLIDGKAEHPTLWLRSLWWREELKHEAPSSLDQGHPCLLPATSGVQSIPCHQTDQTLPFTFNNCLCASALPLPAKKGPGPKLDLVTAGPVEEVEGLALGDPLEGEPPEEGSLLVHGSSGFQLLVAVVTEVPIIAMSLLFLLVFTIFRSIWDFLPIVNVGHRMGFDVL